MGSKNTRCRSTAVFARNDALIPAVASAEAADQHLKAFLVLYVAVGDGGGSGCYHVLTSNRNRKSSPNHCM